jgi:hypothetical protein
MERCRFLAVYVTVGRGLKGVCRQVGAVLGAKTWPARQDFAAGGLSVSAPTLSSQGTKRSIGGCIKTWIATALRASQRRIQLRGSLGRIQLRAPY